ncbi:MAG: protein-L-isoaspartate(D-aspartate) O-methyltransferase [Gammaproteobacteria bacterium]
MTLRLARALLIVCLLPFLAAAEEDRYAVKRRALLTEIQREAAATADLTGRPRIRARVTAAMDAVPRHEFVSADYVDEAYDNRPLPIGHGQTISQPYIVAIMTELLDPEPDDVMLEIGAGSGYQAAVLARLVKQVKSIEIIAPLADSARRRLLRLGYENVEVKLADGYFGWPEYGPYDGIIVTAAAAAIPPPLIAQLKPGGRMVIPVGAPFYSQDLIVVEKDVKGKITTRSVLPVAFVPLTGDR